MPRRMSDSSALVRSICDYLDIIKVWNQRQNSGAAKIGKYTVKLCRIGTADILATPIHWEKRDGLAYGTIKVLWIECKWGTGRQSIEQKNFQEEVESEGHFYIIARSIDDVKRWMREQHIVK